MTPEQIVENYSSRYSAYEALSQRTASLLGALAKSSSISFHVIEHRAKTVDSLIEKIRRPGKSYSSLEEITDLSGVRVICYYQDDCEEMSQIIEREFLIVGKEDSHSAKHLSEDRFGYLSLHRIVKPARVRANLIEWSDVADLCCEIQVRTVIQHAWAAVSHQVQYKIESKIPSLIKRRLNRISGLFEMADEQFVQVRDERAKILSDSKDLVKKDDLSFAISPSSVQIVLNKWSNDNEAPKKIKSIGFIIFDDSDPDFEGDGEVISSIVDICQENSIEQARELLNIAGSFDREYMKRQLSSHPSKSWSISTSFSFLLHIIRNVERKPTLSDLVGQGWGEDIAERVLEVAENDD
ncbi:GTP pyrophosphokinase [Sphingopyxis witflariensis]|uniref:GTP pyrophosphokinase n=1 Tax=Sphingopyxis witflariensis TaxID=173675 RepID=UPI001303D616|nr:hypothetical protein [Sphingopyxis witflariensis]